MTAIQSTARADDPPAREESVTTTAEAAIQAALSDLSRAADAEAFDRQMRRLNEMARTDGAKVIDQLLLFAASEADREKNRALVGRVLKRLETSKSAIVSALVPHLDDQIAAIRESARELLSGYEDRSVTRPPDFSAYRDLIEADIRAGRAPRKSLIVHMYNADAGTALTTLVRAYQLRDPEEIKPILWAEHVVADLLWKRRYGFVARDAVEPAATEQLDKMSHHARWWVRLYVTRIASNYPELAAPATLKRLDGDSNVLVKETIQLRKSAARPKS